MTYIITTRTKESILMASDTRLNYFNDKIINDEKYQEIVCVADCIRKTFFIDKAKIGIQFLGIGYFSDTDNEKYPLSHFIEKIKKEKYVKNFKRNARIIFSFLKSIRKKGNTGQYIKGIMCGFFKKDKSLICTFNTYNNEFEIKNFDIGQFVDSENNKNIFPNTEIESIKEINRRINERSKNKFWIIGGQIEILKITKENGVYVQENKEIFNGSQKELVDYFNNDLIKIKGKILPEPHLEKYTT